MADFTLRPHSFVVRRNDGANLVPPVAESWVDVLSGDCNTQTNASGGMGNDSEALEYDYVLFYDFQLDEDENRIQDAEIKVGDEIVSNVYGKEIKGEVRKWLPGQITNRIWFNEISK